MGRGTAWCCEGTLPWRNLLIDLALVILTTASPFIALAWWANKEDQRRHERRMKELEIERLKQEARTTTWRTVEELSK